MVLCHPDVKDYMKDNGLDKNNLSPDEEIAVYQAYTRAMESNPENPTGSRAKSSKINNEKVRFSSLSKKENDTRVQLQG